jgi:hypothetical protein
MPMTAVSRLPPRRSPARCLVRMRCQRSAALASTRSRPPYGRSWFWLRRPRLSGSHVSPDIDDGSPILGRLDNCQRRRRRRALYARLSVAPRDPRVEELTHNLAGGTQAASSSLDIPAQSAVSSPAPANQPHPCSRQSAACWRPPRSNWRSTAKPSPPTRRSAIARRTTISNIRRRASLSRETTVPALWEGRERGPPIPIDRTGDMQG